MLQQPRQELGNLMPVSITQCLKKKLEESRVTLDLLTAQLFIPMGKGKTVRIDFFCTAIVFVPTGSPHILLHSLRVERKLSRTVSPGSLQYHRRNTRMTY